MAMQALAINASPRMDKGNTALVLSPFLNGLREAGARVEAYYTQKLDIRPCQGEYHCWFKDPGTCYRHDDMQDLLPRIGAADVLVLATPLYLDGVSGPMKTLLDRTIPLSHPFFELRDDHCRHPKRSGGGGKLVLVSNCGFWEMDNFDPLLAHMEAVSRNLARDFAGALLRPHGPAMGRMAHKGAPPQDVLDAAREAGIQLARDGAMSPGTLETVGRELLPRDEYIRAANQAFRRMLGE
jgi:multimeric flavodoxin WrbA